VRTQLASLYFDIAIAGTAASLVPVLELTKPDHIVFGTDFPPATVPVIDQNIAALGTLTCMSEVEKSAIYQNASRLFRRLGGNPRGLVEDLPSTNQPDGLMSPSLRLTRVSL
jgi:predicted TIM-barrel fold metal-dependent hydrolase